MKSQMMEVVTFYDEMTQTDLSGMSDPLHSA